MNTETASSDSGAALIKKLASCDQASRGRALRALLKTWLPNQVSLSDEDMKKLWKGLFYCVWHSDKAPAQSDLIDRLSSLLLSLHLPLALHFFSAFILTTRREWHGIDALRLDKFYLLIRRFVSCFFALMKKNAWELETVENMMRILMDGTFFAEDKFPGKGVRYHVANVFVDELRGYMPLRKEVAEALVVGFIRVIAKTDDKVLVGKVKGSVFDVLVENGRRLLEARKAGQEIEDGDDVVLVFGAVGLCLGFGRRFQEMGESEECLQGNRKVLFALGEEFLKLEKEVEASGVVIEIPEVVNEDEEVPSLIPITGMDVDNAEVGEAANGAAKKRLKKCKKSEKDTGGADEKAERKKKRKQKKKKENKEKMEKKENGILDSLKSNMELENDNVVENGESPDNEMVSDGDDELKLDDDAISNLQMQFDKIAAEAGLGRDLPSACGLPEAKTNGPISKKRKRVKKAEEEVVEDPAMNGKSGEKSAKKVKFSMKNNLVWKHQTPLPPQNLRLPPSATPRGSALKQGVPPGPIREMQPATKKVKRVVKKTRKVRVKKLKSRST